MEEIQVVNSHAGAPTSAVLELLDVTRTHTHNFLQYKIPMSLKHETSTYGTRMQPLKIGMAGTVGQRNGGLVSAPSPRHVFVTSIWALGSIRPLDFGVSWHHIKQFAHIFKPQQIKSKFHWLPKKPSQRKNCLQFLLNIFMVRNPTVRKETVNESTKHPNPSSLKDGLIGLQSVSIWPFDLRFLYHCFLWLWPIP